MHRLLVLFLSLVLIQGCASTGNKVLEQKIAQEPEISNSDVLRQEAQADIDQDQSLSAEQKAKLTQLREKTSSELARIRSESLKLRDILIKDFEAENDAEIELIRYRLKDLNDRQVSVMFKAIKEANKIIGHLPQRNRAWVNEVFMGARGRF